MQIPCIEYTQKNPCIATTLYSLYRYLLKSEVIRYSTSTLKILSLNNYDMYVFFFNTNQQKRYFTLQSIYCHLMVSKFLKAKHHINYSKIWTIMFEKHAQEEQPSRYI